MIQMIDMLFVFSVEQWTGSSTNDAANDTAVAPATCKYDAEHGRLAENSRCKSTNATKNDAHDDDSCVCTATTHSQSSNLSTYD